MPAKDDVYLSVLNGIPSWTPPPTEHACNVCSNPCPCLPCTWSAVDAGREVARRLTKVGSEHLIQESKWPLVSSKLQSNYKTPPWEMALENLPKLSISGKSLTQFRKASKNKSHYLVHLRVYGQGKIFV